MLILKQNAANTVPTPPAGKGTIFLDDSDVLSVKTSSGDVENFPTVAASNSQVVFMNGSALSGEAALTYDFNNNVLTVNGNVAAGNVKTDNLLYANGTPWDLSDPGGSNTQVQFNDDESFGGSAAFTFNKTSNLVSMGGALSVTGNANVNNLGTAQVLASANVTAPQFISNISTGSAPLVVTSTTRVANLDVEKAGIANTVNDAAQPNITSVGTLTGLTVSSTITGSVSGTAATVTTAAQPNITSVGTLTTLSVSGNAIVGNIGAAAGVFTDVSGNGSALTALNASNVSSGTLAQARLANASSTLGNTTLTLGGTVTVVTGLSSITATTFFGDLSGAATTATTVTSAAQPNITSVGTLGGLAVNGAVLVDGTITAVSVVANTGTFTGNGSGLSALNASNVSSGTLAQARLANASLTLGSTSLTLGDTVTTVAGLSSVTSTTFVGALTGAATTAGTVTTAAQPNITSVGTLTSLDVSGNANVGNLGTAGLITATGNVSGGNLTTAGVVAATGNVSGGNLTTAGALSVTGNANVGNIGAAAGVFTTVSGNGSELTNLNASNISSGTLAQARLANASLTLGNTTLTLGDTVTTVAGLTSVTSTTFVGALTGAATTAGTAATVTTAAQPNITSVGTLTSLDVSGNITAANITANLLSVSGNANVGNIGATTGVFTGNLSVSGNAVVNGNLNVEGNLVYINVSDLSVEDSIIQLQTGPNAAPPSSNTGLDVGTALNYYDTQARIAFMGWDTSAAEFGMASVATIANEVVTFSTYGNLRVGNIIGNGQALTGLNASNISSGTLEQARLANASLTVNGTSITLGASGTITANTNQQLAFGSYLLGSGGATGYNGGSLVILSVNGNVGNEANTLVARNADGNIIGGNVYANSGTIGASLLTGTLTTAAQPNITSVGTLSALTVSGTISGSVSGSAGTAATVTTAAQPNITSVGTLTSLTVSGNVSTGNVSGTLLTGTLVTAAQPNITSVGTLTGLTVSSTISGSVSGTAATVTTAAQPNITSVGTLTGLTVSSTISGSVSGSAATVTTAAQPNITSVGTLTSLTVSGNISAQANVTVTGYTISSVATGISAAGSTQGTATVLAKDINVVATVSAGQGVVLPTAVAGMRITVLNTSGTALSVYPASSGVINSLSTNAAFSLAAGARLDFVATTTTQWFTLNATYA